MEKLRKIQTELKAPKNQYNNFGKYKYRNAGDILEAVKPLLAKHQLTMVISDEIIEIASRVYVKATVDVFDGNEKISASAFAREPESKKGMDESQVTGAASSYARKYALNGMFCIDDTKDSDSMKPPVKKPQLVKNTDAYNKVVEALKSKKFTIEQVKTKYSVSVDLEKELKTL